MPAIAPYEVELAKAELRYRASSVVCNENRRASSASERSWVAC